MKLVKCLITFSLVFGCLSVKAQVKIGDNPTSINANSILELEASNKGFLLPRVALTSVSSSVPLSSFVYGMMVFNTATAGTGSTAVKPGIYYSDGARWIRIEVQSTLGTSWTIDGNTATSPSHFLGTTDNNPLVLKTNSNEALRITPDGKVGIGTATPTTALDINGQLKVTDVQSGGLADSLLVLGSSDKVVKRVSADSYVRGMQKQLDIVATNGQQIFNTPIAIVDERKISLYRNGVMIGFTVAGTNAIKAEIACYSGDEIRIVQLQ